MTGGAGSGDTKGKSDVGELMSDVIVAKVLICWRVLRRLRRISAVG